MEPFLGAVVNRLSEQIEEFEPEVAAHARYALMNQGKQFRPVLVGLSAEATGGLNEEHVAVAAIIEMVHLATLVHDDVMDEAELRRRRPTLASRAGNTISVLVGDCLFAHALMLAAGFPTTEVCRAVASATKTVCTGEIIQSERDLGGGTSRAEYFRILRMKTAELFALSSEMGAELSGATADERSALREYGMALGTAYQIYDDCVDLFGSEADAGKSLGTDLINGKATLPVIVALERANERDRIEIGRMIREWDPARLHELRALVNRHDALTESRETIRAYCESAGKALSPLGVSEARDSLVAGTEFIVQQTEALEEGV